MRKMRTLFLVLLCCGLSLYAGVSYVNAEEKVPSDYDAYLQETGMPENEIQKLDEHVKQFIVDDLKSGDGKFEYMKINAEEQMMNGSAEDFTGIEFYASAFKNGSAILCLSNLWIHREQKALWKRQLLVFTRRGDQTV